MRLGAIEIVTVVCYTHGFNESEETTECPEQRDSGKKRERKKDWVVDVILAVAADSQGRTLEGGKTRVRIRALV